MKIVRFFVLVCLVSACSTNTGKKLSFPANDGSIAGSGAATAGTTGGTAGTNGNTGTSGAGGTSGDGGPNADASDDAATQHDAAVTHDAAVGGDADVDADTDAGFDAGYDSGTDSGTIDPLWPPPPATTELQGLPDAWATAVCSALSTCVNPSYYEAAFDGSACKERVRPQVANGEFVYLQASIDAHRVTFDKTALSTCFSEIAALGCSVLSSRAPAHCNTALHGEVPKAGACVIDSDCVTGTFCDRSVACPGMCADLLGEGATCDRSDQCQAGRLCDAGKCRAPATNGGMCDYAGYPPCALGTICTGSDSSMNKAGMCVDQATAFSNDVGTACDPGGGKWCKAGEACVVDLKANPTGPTDLEVVCKTRVASGASCRYSFATEQCPEAEYCPADVGNGVYMSTCAVRPTAGMACGVYSMCAEGLRCRTSDNKCHALGNDGDKCSADEDCGSARCKSGKCAAPSRCRLDAVGPTCGDDSCDPNETCTSCALDCGKCPAVCGDTKCEAPETCSSCKSDCGNCPAVCGDHTCDASENCQTCPGDCGACPAPYSGPCANDAACGPGKKCVQASVTVFPAPPVNYAYCAETCSTAATCSGNAMQRQCNGGGCALRCNLVLGVLDPTYVCPTGMTCNGLTSTCTWPK